MFVFFTSEDTIEVSIVVINALCQLRIIKVKMK